MYEALYDALRQLDDTSASGFEGFVKAILDGFAPSLGIAFLSKSGYQGGVDASSAGFRTTWAALECKHYAPGKCPRAVELIGGLDLAISNSREQLDLWLLVTTGAVGANEAKELRLAGERAGSAVEIIDWQLAGLPLLAVLCAADHDFVLSELEQRLPSLDEQAIKSDLESIAAHQAFEEHRRQLTERLTAAHLGYSRASEAANRWIDRCLGSRQNAYARLNQYLCPGDTEFSIFVGRPAVRQGLDNWLSRWRTDHLLAIAIGREGVGKSWAVMDWWSNLPERPLTLLVTSNIMFPSADPVALMAHLLYSHTASGSQEFWEKAIRRWLLRPAPDIPIILIIFDGINERPADSWVSRLAGFRDEALENHVALLVTCWKSYWEERLEARMPDVLPYHLVPVEPFSDAELWQALEQNDIAFDDVRPDVREFLRVPRVFRAAIGHLSLLMATNDLTIERLLVTDVQFRLRDRSGITLTERQFNDLVTGLARDLRDGNPEFSRSRLRELSSLAQLSPEQSLERDIEEIIAGNLFERLDADGRAYRVRPEYTGLALGMVLADEVRTAARSGRDTVVQAIGTSLDSFSDLSQTSSVIHGAVACACLWSNFPQDGVEELLLAWLRQRNRPEERQNDFAAYLADQPTAYLNVAERVWTDFSEFPDGRRWIAAALLHYLDQPSVFDVIRNRAVKWLSIWHREWHPFLGSTDQERLDQQRSAINERWASKTASERQLISDYLIEADYAEAPYLANLAFLIASFVDRSPFSKGFAAWALSRTLMRLPVDFDNAAWCLRLTRTDFYKTKQTLLAEAQGFYAADGTLSTNAANLLLRALGTLGATTSLPPAARRAVTSPIRQMSIDALDPAAMQPSRNAPLYLLSRLDPAQIHEQMSVGPADIYLDDVEPVLAAFDPSELAQFVRWVILTAPVRSFTPLRQMSLFAVTHAQLIGPEEHEALETARDKIVQGTIKGAESDRWFAESELFLAVLPSLDAKEQYERLIQRPLDALLRNDMEPIFGTLPPDDCNAHLEALEANKKLSMLRAALWFLSTQKFNLAHAARGVLVSLFGHDDAIVRSLALRLAVGCGDGEALLKHFESGWQFSDEPSDNLVNFYGTVALGAREGELRYDDLRGRAQPELLGWIATKDGSEEAIRAFAEDLDAIWHVLSATDVADRSRNEEVIVTASREQESAPELDYLASPSVLRATYQANVALTPATNTEGIRSALEALSDPDAFERQEARLQERTSALIERAKEQGVRMFGHRFRREGLREVVQQRPDLVEKWVSALEAAGSQNLIWRAGDFYRAIAGAIARVDPERATEIIQRLRSAGTVASRTVYVPLRIDAVLYEGFTVVDEPHASNLRDNWVDEAVTDDDLFQLALVAQDTGNQDWLANVIERDAGATILAVQARALTLLGFLDEGPELTRLRSLLNGQQGYLSEVAETAEERLERNRRARYWFQEFLTRADNELSWAAMRLALRCMDRRYYLWSDKLIENVETVPELRRRVLLALKNDISNSIERNETKQTLKLRDTLFGTKILKGELHPWLQLA